MLLVLLEDGTIEAVYSEALKKAASISTGGGGGLRTEEQTDTSCAARHKPWPKLGGSRRVRGGGHQ